MQISAFGAIAGLSLAIFLIVRKSRPSYSLMLGALVGGLVGGASLSAVDVAVITVAPTALAASSTLIYGVLL